ncbi:hypothetical protein FGO68_gene4922 [Halteria grandinella]|uniref:Uncharacterized protein n=1 Tax=Halteria grandinella TaxID=5974 RepID=A0A8J8NEJ0_HALGN|nr:hypothetical protein FGO68_gene4922 [Halteria grandinella]
MQKLQQIVLTQAKSFKQSNHIKPNVVKHHSQLDLNTIPAKPLYTFDTYQQRNHNLSVLSMQEQQNHYGQQQQPIAQHRELLDKYKAKAREISSLGYIQPNGANSSNGQYSNGQQSMRDKASKMAYLELMKNINLKGKSLISRNTVTNGFIANTVNKMILRNKTPLDHKARKTAVLYISPVRYDSMGDQRQLDLSATSHSNPTNRDDQQSFENPLIKAAVESQFNTLDSPIIRREHLLQFDEQLDSSRKLDQYGTDFDGNFKGTKQSRNSFKTIQNGGGRIQLINKPLSRGQFETIGASGKQRRSIMINLVKETGQQEASKTVITDRQTQLNSLRNQYCEEVRKLDLKQQERASQRRLSDRMDQNSQILHNQSQIPKDVYFPLGQFQQNPRRSTTQLSKQPPTQPANNVYIFNIQFNSTSSNQNHSAQKSSSVKKSKEGNILRGKQIIPVNLREKMLKKCGNTSRDQACGSDEERGTVYGEVSQGSIIGNGKKAEPRVDMSFEGVLKNNGMRKWQDQQQLIVPGMYQDHYRNTSIHSSNRNQPTNRSMEIPANNSFHGIFHHPNETHTSNYQQSYLHKQQAIQSEIRDNQFILPRNRQRNNSRYSDAPPVVSTSRENLNMALQMMDKHSRVARIVKDIMKTRQSGVRQSMDSQANEGDVEVQRKGRKLVFKSEEKVFMPRYSSTVLSAQQEEDERYRTSQNF